MRIVRSIFIGFVGLFSQLAVAGPYDGAWSVSLTSSISSYGVTNCGTGSGSLTIDAGQISGSITDSHTNIYTVAASVAKDGTINNGAYAYSSGTNAVIFSGSFSGNSGSGQWADIYGCYGTYTAVQTWANPSETPDTTTTYFDGNWSGSTTTDSSYSDGAYCSAPTVTFDVSNGQVTGTAYSSYYGVTYIVSASVSSTGMVNSGSFALSDINAATFSGSLSDTTGSGSWNDLYGCTGTWSVTRPSAPNNSPIAYSGAMILKMNETYTGALSGSDADNDSLSYEITSPTAHGTVQITNSTAGTFSYQPNSDFVGTDQFEYWVYDGKSYSLSQPIELTVILNIDTDSDGVNDASDPFPFNPLYSQDTDSDGLPDEWENSRIGNLDASGTSDTDGDGVSDLDEFEGGTDPLVATTDIYSQQQLNTAVSGVISWITYDDFSSDSISYYKWSDMYFSCGRQAEVSGDSAYFSGDSHVSGCQYAIPSTVQEHLEDIEGVPFQEINDESTEANSWLLLDLDDVYGIEADIMLPGTNTPEAGVSISATMLSAPHISANIELRNEDGEAILLYELYDAANSTDITSLEQMVSFDTTYNVGLMVTDTKVKFYRDGISVHEADRPADYQYEVIGIGAFNDNGDSFDAYIDNVKILTSAALFTEAQLDTAVSNAESAQVTACFNDPASCGIAADSFPTLISYSVSDGWNLIGGIAGDTDLETFLSDYEADAIWGYTSGGWKHFKRSGTIFSGDLEGIEQGMGYWVKKGVSAP